MKRLLLAAVVTVAVLVAVLAYRSKPAKLAVVIPMTVPPTTALPTTLAPTTTVVAHTTTTTRPRVTTTTSTVPVTFAPRSAVGTAVPTHVPGSATTYGVVQVEVTAVGSKITGVQATALPPTGDTNGAGTKPTTTSISDYAAPILEREALRAQGAGIQTVTGATYTSQAFVASLQSALAKLGL